MKIGILYKGLLSQSGGAYTFEQEIINSFIVESSNTAHDIVFFSDESFIEEKHNNNALAIKTVILPKRSLIEKFYRYLIADGFFNTLARFRKLQFTFSTLNKSLKRNEIDVMLFINPIHEIVDIPYITIVWDLQHRLQPGFPEVSANGEWHEREVHYKNILQRASIIITGTSVGKYEISLFYGIPKTNIKVIPFFTPHFPINNKTLEDTRDFILKYKIDCKYIFYPSQYWPHKNHVNLLMAIKKLNDLFSLPIKLICVGSDKGNLSYLNIIVDELKLTDCVQLLGFVPRDDLQRLYENAFALVYPTFFGPDNLPPLEAFSLGCPVIASNISGASEQLGDAAILIDPKSPEGIAQAIKTLHDDPSLRNILIKRGYDRANLWKGKDYVKEIILMLDEYEKIRRCWE